MLSLNWATRERVSLYITPIAETIYHSNTILLISFSLSCNSECFFSYFCSKIIDNQYNRILK